MLYFLIAALITAILYLIFLLYLLNRQINDLSEQINFVISNSTNVQISSKVPFKNIKKLVDCINQILNSGRDTELKLNRANKNFKQLITSISHDLRTPLTSASGYIQIINKNSVSEQKKKQYLEVIQNRILAVQRLQNQLFELARIESNEIELLKTRVDLNNILRDTLSIFYYDFFKKNQEPLIKIPETPYFSMVDENALKRVFENIIYNSLIHGQKEYVISSTDCTENYRITFENKSEELKKEDIDNIFERFYTTDKSHTRKTTGLGLSISKHLVEMMDGKIEAQYQNGIFKIIIFFPKCREGCQKSVD